MKIISFEGCNVQIPFLNNAPAMMQNEGNLKMFLFAMQPSEEDIKMIKVGKPIFFQVYQEVKPFMIYTVNDKGLPNLEQQSPTSKIIPFGTPAKS